MKKTKGFAKVRCECGDEILVFSDLKATGRAIDDHVDLHLQNLKAPGCNAAEAERLKDALIAQVIGITGQHENEEDP
jgi:hypothetical protein